MKPRIKPRQILLSKRANVFYLEHVRVMQKDDRVVYLNYSDTEIDQFFNIPERNTVFILLGKGTSITDAAVRKLSDSNIVVGFVGNGGSPLFSIMDYAFLTPQSEYRPTEYMQAWMRMWLDDAKRLHIAKQFMRIRLDWTQQNWQKNADLKKHQIIIHNTTIEVFLRKIEQSQNTGQLMAVEAEWAKKMYQELARGFKLSNFRREEGKRSRENSVDVVNSFLDHGNYIAYGYAASALNVLGISFALPVMHGKTRRGALVFDVADLFKDAFIMSEAFGAGSRGDKDQEFRDQLIDICHESKLLDDLINTLIETIQNHA